MEHIKSMVARETLLHFPDFQKSFHVYTNASNDQLGAVIMKGHKSLAFYSLKLAKAKRSILSSKPDFV